MKVFLGVALAAAAVLAPPPHRVGQAGVTVRLPRGWSSIPLVLPGAHPSHDPVTRIVAASGPIGFGQCGDIDYNFPATAVALVVVEWLRPTPGRFAPRPAHFTAHTLP